jgi:3-oxoacyl-[acyl-carrier protein] reductase
VNLQGKVALVTGASRGIGAAIATRLAADGADVVLGYLGDACAAGTVAATIRATGRRALAVRADIAHSDQVRTLFADALAAMGGIDIVVANAGVELVDIPFADYTESQYDWVFAVNAKGTFLTPRQAAAVVVPDGGRIIVVSSNTTRLWLPGFAVYGASKLAGNYFVQVLAKELGARRVTVNTVIPGATRAAGVFTDSSDDDRTLVELTRRTPLGRLGTPADTAAVVAFLAGDQAGFITGQHLTVDGGAAIG